MNVLSLFDGMSCGQIALGRVGIKVDNYFASEIDKNAIKVTMANYPYTIQLGSVVDIDVSKLPRIDLLLGGSPCQGFSFAGKGLNFEDSRSKLFFEYVRIYNELRESNPRILFLMENVKMKFEHEKVITGNLKLRPCRLNSKLVSAQNRKRLYWTNIPVNTIPKDKHLFIKDILEGQVDEKYFHADGKYNLSVKDNSIIDFSHKNEGVRIYENKAPTLNARDYKEPRCVAVGDNRIDNLVIQLNTSKQSGGKQPYQQDRVYHEDGAMVTLDTRSDQKNIYTNQRIRKITPVECERLQNIPDNYTNYVSDSQRYKMIGNGWTVDIVAHILKHIK